MDYTLDNRDLKIIDTIADNGRLPYSKIARLTRISKDRVRERINNLKKEKYLLSYIPLINYNSLGYELYTVYIVFKNKLKKEKEYINKIKNHSKIISLTAVPSVYDFELQILAKNKSEIDRTIKELKLERYGKIAQKVVLKPDVLHIYSMGINEKSKKNIDSTNKYSKKIKIDELDLNILKILSNNSRERIIDIAEKVNVHFDVVRYRVKKLLEHKIILGFYARTNKHRFGLNTYVLLIKLKNKMSQYQFEKLKERKNIYYVKTVSGKWSLIINCYCKDNTDLVETIEYIKKSFENNIDKQDILILLERYFFSPIPKNFKID
ncbi:MAG TPA: Lrp/AsnC family transcriptional regulator [Candidatus Nanoarchaeia archaeon]|nr:Lrp/AsnC family transcriptional regulator [Candidatus Nanoarchaeia archaeon]